MSEHGSFCLVMRLSFMDISPASLLAVQVSWSTYQFPSSQDSLLHVGKILLQTQELFLSSVLCL